MDGGAQLNKCPLWRLDWIDHQAQAARAAPAGPALSTCSWQHGPMGPSRGRASGPFSGLWRIHRAALAYEGPCTAWKGTCPPPGAAVLVGTLDRRVPFMDGWYGMVWHGIGISWR